MREIETLSTLEGRKLLQEIYRELHYERRMSSLSVLTLTWRICALERELFRFSRHQVTLIHHLGIFSGTSLWLQEVVSRFYFPIINSLVYFGAAVLLITVGLRRVYDRVPDSLIVGSIVLEAFLLLLMFVVMLFSPPDDDPTAYTETGQTGGEVSELVREVGEIARDYASVSVRLDSIGDTLENIAVRQEALIAGVRDAVQHVALAVAPNPALMDSMRETGDALREFTGTIHELKSATDTLRREEIEKAVARVLSELSVAANGKYERPQA